MTSRAAACFRLWMDQSPTHFGAVAGDRSRLAACLSPGERDLLLEEDAQVSTGAAPAGPGA